MYGYVIFTDIEKYSTLKDAELKVFYDEIHPFIMEKLKDYQDVALIWNTWGDAIVAVFDKAESAINMALTYRDAYKEFNFEQYGLNKLATRTAGHFGEFEYKNDPETGKKNIHGTLINLTARIEPVTLSNEIFVTRAFKDMSCSSYDKVDNVRFDDMGEVKLPKNAGEIYLYRMRKKEEAPIPPVGTVLFPVLNAEEYIYEHYNNAQAIFDSTKKSQKNASMEKIERTLRERLADKDAENGDNTEKVEKNPPKQQSGNVKKIKETIKNIKNIQDDMGYKAIFAPENFDKRKFFSNPFVIVSIIFLLASFIDFVFEIYFVKDFINYLGAQYNNMFVELNKITNTNLFSNPIGKEQMAFINSWLWLRGITISAFITVYIASIKDQYLMRMKFIYKLMLIIGLFHFTVSFFQSGIFFSMSYFTEFTQKIYMDIFVLMMVCLTAMNYASEFANRGRRY